MRIWSKELIPCLPNKQLMAMRYELGDMIKQYPNIKNGLVRFANNYDIAYLFSYFVDTFLELKKRKINMSSFYNMEIYEIVKQKTKKKFIRIQDNLRFKEDDQEYLQICLMNLYEKHLRGMIPEVDWKEIKNRYLI